MKLKKTYVQPTLKNQICSLPPPHNNKWLTAKTMNEVVKVRLKASSVFIKDDDMVAQYRSYNQPNTTQLFLRINLLIACNPLIVEADIFQV